MDKRLLPRCLFSASALALGTFIYLYFRVPFGSIHSNLTAIDGSGSTLISALPEWIIYSLPDGLWAFAYALLITSIWANNQSEFKNYWMASIPILTLGFEFLQLTNYITGTFCVVDLVSILIGISIGWIIGKIK